MYRPQDDVELMASRYARETAPGSVSDPRSPCLLTKGQVAALLRDAFTAGHVRALEGHQCAPDEPERPECPHADVTHSTEWCGCTCPGEGIVLGKGVISGK